MVLNNRQKPCSCRGYFKWREKRAPLGQVSHSPCVTGQWGGWSLQGLSLPFHILPQNPPRPSSALRASAAVWQLPGHLDSKAFFHVIFAESGIRCFASSPVVPSCKKIKFGRMRFSKTPFWFNFDKGTEMSRPLHLTFQTKLFFCFFLVFFSKSLF